MMKQELDQSRIELSVKLKNGANFLLAGSILWIPIALMWALQPDVVINCWSTLAFGGFVSPLALLLGRLWKIPNSLKGNPLNPVPFMLNFGQFLYYPLFLLIIYTSPEHFPLVLATVTGAHLLPFAWPYKCRLFFVFPPVMVAGVALLFLLAQEAFFAIPAFMCAATGALACFLFRDAEKKRAAWDGPKEGAGQII
ncbi:MAG: hypothetical protein LBL66_05910 [Clostridiales bacterium]|jgi:hypothetical protein|nr:hypothetical protein [Clostridiales bacterium]